MATPPVFIQYSYYSMISLIINQAMNDKKDQSVNELIFQNVP